MLFLGAIQIISIISSIRTIITHFSIANGFTRGDKSLISKVVSVLLTSFMFFFGMMFRSLQVTSICWFLASTRGSVLRNNSEPDPIYVLTIAALINSPASFVLNLCIYIFNGKIFGEDKSQRSR